jgi:maltooligosyltrehalose trehalohydrolase
LRPSIHSSTAEQTYELGARVADGVAQFVVWAPEHALVELVVHRAGGDDVRPLRRDERGYWSGAFEDLGAGTLYRYRLNRSREHTFPDPASRFQPRGVHGPSQVVDPRRYTWNDRGWNSPALEQLVFYELHVGTFTPAGTFDGVAARLPYLKQLGVTAIELMPVGDFPGRHNWGYDSVAIYAPARCYGTPDSLRALVDAAHGHGLAVVLDVVYNHFGPDGAYATAFSPYYLSQTHTNPWGPGLNFDGPHSADVRRFFIENALQWLGDYHVDALRLDATHAIVDDGTPHFLAELTSALRAETGRDVVIVAEDHRNLTQMLEPVQKGGYGLDAVWADDFHHQARVHTAGDRDGYYADFTGSTVDLARTLTQGWFYTGQMSAHAGEPRGTDPAGLSLPQFVLCIQNHDQIGNRGDGARLHHQIDPGAYRALSTVLLLAPHTPLLFMGQEWAASSPFQFFTDHHEELGKKVTEGRRAEFAAFEGFRDEVPDPQAPETFDRSRLRWRDLQSSAHIGVLRLYERLLELRRTEPTLQGRGRYLFEARALDDETIAIRRVSTDRSAAALIIARLSGSGQRTVPIGADVTAVLLSTEDDEFVESPAAIGLDPGTGTVRFSRPGAIVLATR